MAYVDFTKKEVLFYLDQMIDYWRAERDAPPEARGYTEEIASCYIDAYQSVRRNLFGETKPE